MIAGLIEKYGADVEKKPLPVWPGLELVETVVHLPHRPQLFRHAEDGQRRIALDTPADVEALAARRHTVLDATTAADYVRLWLAVNGDALVESRADLRWTGSIAEAPEIQALQVSPELQVDASIVRGRDLFRLRLELDRNGRVRARSEELIAADLPIAYRA